MIIPNITIGDTSVFVTVPPAVHAAPTEKYLAAQAVPVSVGHDNPGDWDVLRCQFVVIPGRDTHISTWRWEAVHQGWDLSKCAVQP
jgi:hypothetical protein